MISILFDKEDKKTAISISKALQSKGYKTTLRPYQPETTQQEEDVNYIILIFSQKSNLSEFLIKQFDVAFENGKTVIPFIISDVEYSISMQFFLNSHDWINAFDVSFKEATNDLAILLGELQNEKLENKPQTKIEKQVTEKKLTNKQKQTYATIGAAIIFLAILIFFMTKGNNNPFSAENPNDLLVGNWKLAKYEDNMQRSPQEFADFQAGVEQLKRNFLLKFKDNGTFEKYGFSVPEKGNWEFDPQNNILFMWPPNSDKQRDMLKVEKLTKDSLIMIIATQIDSLTLINTKFTLYKE
jgi:hypothetical protein